MNVTSLTRRPSLASEQRKLSATLLSPSRTSRSTTEVEARAPRLVCSARALAPPACSRGRRRFGSHTSSCQSRPSLTYHAQRSLPSLRFLFQECAILHTTRMSQTRHIGILRPPCTEQTKDLWLTYGHHPSRA